MIDRYVFFVFLRVFLICCACLTGIYVIGDFVENLNEFIDAAEANGGLTRVMCLYYLGRVPWFLDMIGRVAALIAGVFAVTWLQRNNELTALMAAGISRWRILRPIVIGIVLVSVVSAVNREAVIPRFREQLSQEIRDWSGKKASPLTPQYDHSTDILIDGQQIVAREKKIVAPIFRLPLGMKEFGPQLTADFALQQPADGERPAGFRLLNVQSPAGIDALGPAMIDGQVVIHTTSSAPWLRAGECFVVSHVTFGQLLRGRQWRQFASTNELIAGLHNPSMNLGADARVAVHARVLQPMLDITLFFLGIPVVLARESRNVFVSAGSCILIVAAYFLVVLGCHSLGINYLISPAQAAWAPGLIMIPLAVARSGPLRR